jgi:transposase
LTGFLVGKGGFAEETCVLDETVRFVSACLEGEETMTSLCDGFGISRQWGYELLRRYRAEGLAGLEPRSRAPQRPGRAMAAAIAAAIVALRGDHPSWGPKKLRAVLARRAPGTAWPAASSMGDLLRREGLVRSRRRRRGLLPLSRPVWAGWGTERSVVHRLQGLVSHGRRRALRSADAERCRQPLPARLRRRRRRDRWRRSSSALIFRAIYNEERPHEALGQETPASRYRPSARPYPRRLEEPQYDAAQAVRRVRSDGEIRWGGDLIFLSETLVGEPVGVAETESGDWLVSFAEVPLGLIERRSRKLRANKPGTCQRCVRSKVSMNNPVAQRGGPGGWLGASILAARPTSLSLSPRKRGAERSRWPRSSLAAARGVGTRIASTPSRDDRR